MSQKPLSVKKNNLLLSSCIRFLVTKKGVDGKSIDVLLRVLKYLHLFMYIFLFLMLHEEFILIRRNSFFLL